MPRLQRNVQDTFQLRCIILIRAQCKRGFRLRLVQIIQRQKASTSLFHHYVIRCIHSQFDPLLLTHKSCVHHSDPNDLRGLTSEKDRILSIVDQYLKSRRFIMNHMRRLPGKKPNRDLLALSASIDEGQILLFRRTKQRVRLIKNLIST